METIKTRNLWKSHSVFLDWEKTIIQQLLRQISKFIQTENFKYTKSYYLKNISKKEVEKKNVSIISFCYNTE